MAKIASVNVQFVFGTDNTYIILEGFNDSMKKGIKDVFTKIKNLDINKM